MADPVGQRMNRAIPGSAPNQPMMPGVDPVLSPDLAMAAMLDQIRQGLGAEATTALTNGETQQKFTAVVEKMLLALTDRALNDLVAQNPGDNTPMGFRIGALEGFRDVLTQMGGGGGGGGTGGGGGRPDAQQAHPGAPPPPSGAPSSQRPSEGQPEQQPYVPFKQAYEEGRGMSMTSIAQQASGRVAQFVSEHTPNWTIEDGPDGQQRLVQYDDAGNIANQMTQSDPGFRHTIGRVRQAQFVAGAAGQFAGQGQMAGVLGKIGRFGGPVGMAVGVAAAGTSMLESQQNSATFYRSAFGESGTGMFSASDRLQERLAGLGGIGTIGPERAREQFRQASSLGLRGGRREQATDFATDMYKSLGMETSEAMAVVADSVHEGNISLREYGEAIKDVTKSAVAAGRDAKSAREDFEAAREKVGQTVGPGGNTIDITKNISDIANSMDPRTLAAVGGEPGLAGMLGNQSAQYLIAAQTGVSPMTMTSRLAAGGDTAYNATLDIFKGGGDLLVQTMAQVLDEDVDTMRSEAKAASAKGEVSPERRHQLFVKWAGGESQAGVAYTVLRKTLVQYGLPSASDPENLGIFFSALTGDFDKGEKREGQTASSIAVRGHKGTDPIFGKVSQDYEKGDYKANKRALILGMGGDLSSGSLIAQSTPGFDDYLKEVTKTGVGDKAVESLLKAGTQQDLEAYTGKDLDKQKFYVDDGGKSKAVSYADLLKNPKYRAQLDAGTIQVKGEDSHDSASISDFTKVKGGDDSASKSDDSGKKGSGKVTFDLTPEAKRLLQPLGPSDAQRFGFPSNGVLDPSKMKPFGGN